MFRGTTPTIQFTLPFAASACDEIWITISQFGNEVLTKTKADCSIDGNKVSVTLTQEETLKLRANSNGQTLVQMRVKTNKKAFASKVFAVRAEDILKDGVI